MYIQENVTIDKPIDVCRSALLGDAERWVPHAVENVEESSRDLLAQVGFSVLGVGVHKQVRLHLGEPTVLRDWLHIPIEWHAEPAQAAFPVFQGEIKLIPLDPTVTKLVVAGTYEPPLGPVGRSLDNLALYKVASGTVKRLVHELRSQITRQEVPAR